MPRIAISLGSSFLGYATHAGFMARLHELGVRPVKVAGASAGAIAAGLYAAGLPQQQIKDAVLRWGMRLSFVHGTTWFIHQVRSFMLSRHPSIFHPRAAVTHFENLVGDMKIEDMRSPAISIALTRLDTQEALLAKRGSLAHAMVNSCCVPVMFAPLEHEGAMCVDGGVANELPVDQWFEDPEVDLIIAHRITSPTPARSIFFPYNLMGISGDVQDTAGGQLMRYRQALAKAAGKTMLVVDTVHPRPSMLFGSDLSGYYATGEAQAQQFYDSTLRPLLGT